jgi:hypothetical protein
MACAVGQSFHSYFDLDHVLSNAQQQRLRPGQKQFQMIGSGENEGKQLGGKFGETLVHESGWHFMMLVANSTPPKQ